MRHFILLAFLLPTCSIANAQGVPAWQDPPRLVVGIVVDQMRTDYLYRYWDNFGEGGFKRLVNDGAFLRDAHFDHVPTETGPGHATVYTGTTPAHHGIVANEMVQRGKDRLLYCTADPDVKSLGGSGNAGQRSPMFLLATTIADELERRTEGRSKTIGIALKDRGAILAIGRTGDAAYWFTGGEEGAFVSSTWYLETLPEWVKAYNAQRFAAKHLDRTWDLLLPRERYHASLPDDNPYESPIPGAASATLPLDLKALRVAGASTSLISFTPWGNTLTTDFALAALAGEDLGADAVTDLLAISYSAPDHLGHRMGPRALETEDMYLRLDQDLARLLTELDKRVGAGRYTVFLTADHAAPDLPAYLKDMKGSAAYIDMAGFERDLRAALDKALGKGDWVERVFNEQVFLNDSLIIARGLDRALVQRATAEVLLQNALVSDAVTATDLARNTHVSGIRAMLQRGFMPQRSGDVLFVLRPGHSEPYKATLNKGVNHGSPWNYDTHVPIIFFGHGVVPGEVLRRTSVTDIAPTIAMIVGMAIPDAATGRVVTEVVAR